MKKLMLKNKVALITGSSSGIGKATAELFAEEGASVFITGLHEQQLNEVVEGITAKGHQAAGMIDDVS